MADPSTPVPRMIDPDTVPIGEALSVGSSPAGVPAALYRVRELTPRGTLVMDLLGKLQDREVHQRDVADAKRLIKEAKAVEAEHDDKVGAVLDAIRTLDKGTELEEK